MLKCYYRLRSHTFTWLRHSKGLNVSVPGEELELLLLLEVCPYLAVMLLPAEVGEPVV